MNEGRTPGTIADLVSLQGVWVSEPEEVMTSWGGPALKCILQVEGFYGPFELTVIVRDTRDPQAAQVKKGARALVKGVLYGEDGEVWVETLGKFITPPAGL